MMTPPKAYKTNRLVKHPCYPKVMSEYNERLRDDGKVNAKRFYEEILVKEFPTYSLISWYQFLKKFKTEIGLQQIQVTGNVMLTDARAEVEEQAKKAMMTNQDATTKMLMRLLNISASAAEEVLENPELVPYEKRIKLGLEAMKAQDSRVKAIGTIRQDARDQDRFDHAMDSGAFG